MSEEPVRVRDVRFCPFCFQQSFELSKVKSQFVYCEICGVDVDIDELEREQ